MSALGTSMQSQFHIWNFMRVARLQSHPFYYWMVVSSLWRGPGSIHGFLVVEKLDRQGWATAQTPTVPTISGVRITASSLCACNLTTIA